jgi:hypothetical protein
MFAKQFDVEWPCGYGATLAALARFGAYSTSRQSASYNPGQEVSPTLYLIGPDGRVLWHDEQVLPRHAATAADRLRRLEAAIQKALAPAKG